MVQIHFNTAFENLSDEELNKWIELYKEKLVGSALFTKNNSCMSKIVQWAENWGNKEKSEFTPSHTGSIVEDNGTVYVFDMKPPFASRTPLIDYIKNTKDTYALVLRDFELDTYMFSQNILEHLGEFYPYFSALRSVFSKLQTKWRRHCSELHFRELQKQGLFKDINPEITPEELYKLLTKKG